MLVEDVVSVPELVRPFLVASDQTPIFCMVQASEAPKLSISWCFLERSMTSAWSAAKAGVEKATNAAVRKTFSFMLILPESDGGSITPAARGGAGRVWS